MIHIFHAQIMVTRLSPHERLCAVATDDITASAKRIAALAAKVGAARKSIEAFAEVAQRIAKEMGRDNA